MPLPIRAGDWIGYCAIVTNNFQWHGYLTCPVNRWTATLFSLARLQYSMRNQTHVSIFVFFQDLFWCKKHFWRAWASGPGWAMARCQPEHVPACSISSWVSLSFDDLPCSMNRKMPPPQKNGRETWNQRTVVQRKREGPPPSSRMRPDFDDGWPTKPKQQLKSTSSLLFGFFLPRQVKCQL